MTPQEWRELDPRDSAFLANGFAEAKRIEAKYARERANKVRRR